MGERGDQEVVDISLGLGKRLRDHLESAPAPSISVGRRSGLFSEIRPARITSNWDNDNEGVGYCGEAQLLSSGNVSRSDVPVYDPLLSTSISYRDQESGTGTGTGTGTGQDKERSIGYPPGMSCWLIWRGRWELIALAGHLTGTVLANGQIELEPIDPTSETERMTIDAEAPLLRNNESLSEGIRVLVQRSAFGNWEVIAAQCPQDEEESEEEGEEEVT